MKKFALSLMAGVLMSFGLVAASSSPAAAQNCPYTGCYGTTTEVTGRAVVPEPGRSPRYRIEVLPIGGDVEVQGEVDLTFYRNGVFKALKTSTGAYNGDPIRLRPARPLNRPGIWTVVAHFHSDGPFYPSQDTTITKVLRG